VIVIIITVTINKGVFHNTGWLTKYHTIDCTNNKFLLLQKHLTSGTELILICWKIVPNEEHVQCDHRSASQPLVNKPLHSSQLCRCMDTGGTRPLLLQHRTISFKLLAKSVNCLQGAHLVPKCARKRLLSLYYTLCLCVKQYNFQLLIYSQPPVVRHFTNWCAGFQLWSILTFYDIYRIFHKLQHSLGRLQHRYNDVTILMEL
jgi:hypothetical protein